MLGKLIKYEIKAVYKVFLALLFGSIVLAITIILTTNSVSDFMYSFSFSMLTFCLLGFIAYSILRFKKNLMDNEGYLMNSLPVKPFLLVLSKWIIYVIGISLLATVQLLVIYRFSSYVHSWIYSLKQLHVYIQMFAVFSTAVTVGHLFIKNRKKCTFLLCIASFLLIIANNYGNGKFLYFFFPVSEEMYCILPIITISISISITSYILKRKLNLD